MIHGIGTDIVAYARIVDMYARHGERFAQRVLSSAELSEFSLVSDPARMLAKRFAAKEAFSKAVGSGLRHPVSLRRITVSHDVAGKPVLGFDAALNEHLTDLGIAECHLSLSDERDMVVAFVVLEKR